MLRNIGNPISMPARIDYNNLMTKYIKASMMVVDMIPVNQIIDLTKINERNLAGITYDLTTPINDYKQICGRYGLKNDYSGIRVWSTDETVLQDEFNNEYSENVIEQTITGFANKYIKLNQLRKLSKSIDNFGTLISSTIKALQQTLKPFGHGNSATAVGNIFAKGYHISLPRFWKTSSYKPVFNINIKLMSPYGSPKSIKRHVIEPLLYLLILVTPRSNDGITYGQPPTLFVRSYGNSVVKTGYIGSISIRRGGADVVYSQFRQPLSLNVSMTVYPITDGFAVLTSDVNDNKIDIIDSTYTLDNTTNITPSINKAGMSTLGDIIDSFRPLNHTPNNQVTPDLTSNVVSRQGEQNQFPISNDQTGNPINSISDTVSNTVDSISQSIDNVIGDVSEVSADTLDSVLTSIGRNL